MTAAPIFHAVELDVYAPGSSTTYVPQPHGARPRGVMGGTVTSTATSETLRVSDAGYRTLATDAGGVVAYPPGLVDGLTVSRAANLIPGRAAAAAGWGSLRLANGDGRWNAYGLSRNCDGRAVKLYYGRKTLDVSRGYLMDPAKASLALAFAGVAAPWTLAETYLDVPIRDATYWLERPLQASLYAGTGSYEGGADLVGKPKPKARGGTALLPILNVPAVLIDATNLIYQYSDGPGTVVAIYEGGYAGFTSAGNTSNLYSGTTPAGQYRTDNSRGLFQLGSTPTRQITADVTGQFPTAGAQTTAASIARYLLTEDLALPVSSLDTASLTALDSAYPYTSGIWFGDVVAGVDAINPVLSGLGAQLLPKRDGTLTAVALRAPTGTYTGAISADIAVSLTPRALPSPLAPPAYRWRVGYQRAYAVQTTDLSPSITAARKTLVAAQNRAATYLSSAVQSAWRRPSDPDLVVTALLASADATALANACGALWSAQQRRLFDVVLPLELALAFELGQSVKLSWPTADLQGGLTGMVVGEALRSFDATATLTVLL